MKESVKERITEIKSEIKDYLLADLSNDNVSPASACKKGIMLSVAIFILDLNALLFLRGFFSAKLCLIILILSFLSLLLCIFVGAKYYQKLTEGMYQFKTVRIVTVYKDLIRRIKSVYALDEESGIEGDYFVRDTNIIMKRNHRYRVCCLYDEKNNENIIVKVKHLGKFKAEVEEEEDD